LLAEKCARLFVDEAHHVEARTWHAVRELFKGKPILQFTATPFRNDGKPIEGQILFNYPLGRAQAEGYFRPIKVSRVCEFDPTKADAAIATEAVRRLREDLGSGLDHLLMARCKLKERAEQVVKHYRSLASDLN